MSFSKTSVLLVSGSCCLFAAGVVSPTLPKLPLRFEQADAAGQTFSARAGNSEVNVQPAESWMQSKGRSVRMTLTGADRNASIAALDRLPGVANYFLGRRSQWKTSVVGYGRIKSSNVYPGIDLVFHGEEGRLEYDFLVAPNADARLIRMAFSGQDSLEVDAGGDLVIHRGSESIRWKRPEIYQETGGKHNRVEGRFAASRNRVRFEIEGYDHSKPLVIDPTLAYSTFLGGPKNEGARGIAVDGGGNVYIAGCTSTTNLPTTSGVLQRNFGGETAIVRENGDGFVAKYSASGTLVYLTYLGGSGDDGVNAIALDSAGNAYVTGFTTSTNFPAAGTPYQSQFGGMNGGEVLIFGDAFVAKLNPSGTKLIYSTYLGGNQNDFGTAIVVDSAGDAYVTGATRSTNFPTTPGAYQSRAAGLGGQLLRTCCDELPLFDPGDAFVVELNPTGSSLVFSTLLGGALDDAAFAIARDSSGNVYIGGFTISLDFPTTSGSYQRKFGGSEQVNEFFTFGDGFVAKLNPTGTSLLYSTYFGGGGDDCVLGLAVDSAGNAYITGSTSTSNWTTSAGAFQPKYGGYTEGAFESASPYVEQLIGDAYVAKLNPAGTALVYMSYLGGTNNDGGTAIAVDSAGNAYVTGFVDSQNFPVTSNALQPKWAGDGGYGDYWLIGDAFLTIVNPTGTGLLYSSFFGGRFDDYGLGLAIDASGAVHLAGITVSSNFPITTNAAQPSYGGIDPGEGVSKGDAFVATFTGLVSLPPTIANVANAEGEASTIAPNTWVEVKGTGLTPSVSSPDCAPGYCWQNSDFVNNQLPTSLQGVSVTLNGEKAYVYYLSPGQINVLTPPDLKAGSVTVQVNNNGLTSAAFTAQAQSVSESFFVIGGGPYIVATHLNGKLIGPTSLYPGVTMPAQANETIVIYCNGFGPTTVPAVAGSITQSGTLPTMPVITIGTATATVTFAGLISPGLYQFNVVVPAGLPFGDKAIQASYQGQTTQAGTLITVQ